MASATLNIKVSPRRMLSLREAAEYCGMPAKRFGFECPVAPVAMPHGAKHYDMRDLDGWLDALKAGQPGSDEELIARLGA